MPDSERDRKTRKLIEDLEAFQLMCKQLDHYVGNLIQAFREEDEKPK